MLPRRNAPSGGAFTIGAAVGGLWAVTPPGRPLCLDYGRRGGGWGGLNPDPYSKDVIYLGVSNRTGGNGAAHHRHGGYSNPRTLLAGAFVAVRKGGVASNR